VFVRHRVWNLPWVEPLNGLLRWHVESGVMNVQHGTFASIWLLRFVRLINEQIAQTIIT
jgi:hypothetical protein